MKINAAGTVRVNRFAHPPFLSNKDTNNKGRGYLDEVSFYRIFIKSKKWTLRVVDYFIDVAFCASWIQYTLISNNVIKKTF
jgi:hypothetical protein